MWHFTAVRASAQQQRWNHYSQQQQRQCAQSAHFACASRASGQPKLLQRLEISCGTSGAKAYNPTEFHAVTLCRLNRVVYKAHDFSETETLNSSRTLDSSRLWLQTRTSHRTARNSESRNSYEEISPGNMSNDWSRHRERFRSRIHE